MEHGITWSHLFFGPLEELLAHYGVDPQAGIDTLIVSVGLILFAFFAGRRFRAQDQVEPKGQVNMSLAVESVVVGLLGIFNGILSRGKQGARPIFFLLGSFAFFILASNLLGLVPGFLPPTAQFNVTVVLALCTFFTAHTIGIRAHGLAYVRKFMGPLIWLAPLMLPIELVSHLVRPLSLSVRLFGNMTGDHAVVGVFSSLVSLGLPIPFMGLGMFVSFLQAFVFVLLSAVYFQDALEPPH